MEMAIERPHSWWIDALAGVLDRHLAVDETSETPWIADTVARLAGVQRRWIEELRSLAEVASRTRDPEEMARIVRRARAAFSAAKSLERKKRRAILAEPLDLETGAAD